MMNTNLDRNTPTHLSGIGLVVVRACVGLLLVLMIGLGVFTFSDSIEVMRRPCAGEGCFPAQVTPAGVQVLEQSGFTLEQYAVGLAVVRAGFGMVFVLAGLLIFWRRPNDWIAMLVALVLVLVGAQNALGVAPPTDTTLTLGRLISLGHDVVLANAMVLLLYLFPDGQFAPAWTRWLAVILLPMLIVAFVVQGSTGPFSTMLFALLELSGLYAQIYRYRRVSGPTERQQTKWVIFGFGTMVAPMLTVLPFVILPSVLLSVAVSPFTEPASTSGDFIYRGVVILLILPALSMPVSLAFSILRYRLWDIDFIINRSLVYGVVTMLLLGVFVGSILGIHAVLGGLIGQQQTVFVIAIAVVALGVVFQPARKAVQRLVDRKLYGIGVNYQQVIEQEHSFGRMAVDLPLVLEFGPYRDLECIGRGGMAQVYKAYHSTLDRTVAIKILLPLLAARTKFRHRFEREARIVAVLEHPNIVKALDFGQVYATFFLTMEYLAGRSLDDYLWAWGALPLEVASLILKDVASALDYMHEHGVIHRDVKPANVILEGVGVTDRLLPHQMDGYSRAVLMDFGIARMVTNGSLRTTDALVGTLDYIAPEQIRGDDMTNPRIDVYSLGVMTYQMLTGKLPFKRGNPGAMVMAHLIQPPPDVRRLAPDVSLSVAGAIIRAMAKKPEERFPSAGEFVAALG